jgi:plastocyanin
MFEEHTMRSHTTITVTTAAALVAVALGAGLVTRGGAPAAHAATTKRVKLGEYFYTPKKLTINAGDSIRFVNVGKIEHTVADATKSGTIRSRVIHPRPLKHGASQTVTLRKRGTVYYLCTFHPGLMRGTIVVR